ncbi:alpha-L-rhamnosidase C-terminal domain-containing protein [Streptomyces sp. NPDC023723]|uniref:alpha-L-rhamnosidase-related protein n=1 Tax=Streptomyces sp. NPDC023723 TaxID=3154323 RepID=UPI0033D54B06
MSRSAVAALAVGLVIAAAPPGAAARSGRNHDPQAPAQLTVADRVDPSAVDGTPPFGWLPRDTDAGEVQSAYEVVVRDSRGRAVWDSGKVSGSQQSWVSYAGPGLAPGTKYRWTVRTWDREGAVSPYARPASFTTGLGDGDWSGAQWIRRPASGNDASNEWTAARKVMRVSGRSKVTGARVYVAAMGDWQVNVAGRVVQRSSSYEYAGEGFYDVADLTGVKAGQELPIGVVTHYWDCKCQGRANGPGSSEGPSGLLVKVVVDHADGSRDTMVSDTSWKVHRYDAQRVDTLTYRNADSGDRVEYYDARAELSGWDTAGYDDTGWPAATAVGAHPRPAPASCASYSGGSSPCAFTHLSALQAQLAYSTVHPVSLKRLADGTVFADFGKVYSAVPSVRLAEGTAGRQLTFTTSYRRNNSTLTAAASAGDTTVTLARTSNLRAGDEIVVDAPAAGYGAGAPETRTVRSVQGTTVTLDAALTADHASGSWVENSRAGTSALDTQGSDMRFHYTEKDGAQTARPFTYWGWRYLQISDPGEDLTAADVTAVVQHTQAPHTAAFDSSDDVLDDVFDLMAHSAIQSAQNVFLDTPTREKGQFLADTVNQSYATMAAFGERALTRQAIVSFMNSQQRFWSNGGMNAVYPNGDGKRDIPDFTEMFPDWVWRYYRTTGDRQLLEEALPVMRDIADYVWAAVDSNGLVANLPGGSGPYQYGITDWPAPMRYTTVTSGNTDRTVVNALGVSALRTVARAAEALGDTETRTAYDQRADRLTTAMRTHLFDAATGTWSDGLDKTGTALSNSGQHAQSFPVAYGVADPATYPAAGEQLTALGMGQGPMTLRTLLDALRLTGRTDTLVDLLTDPAQDGPAQVLAEGGTFLWEQWTPGCATSSCTGAQVSQSSSESMSHGWGAGAITAILEGVLGIQVTAPGASEVRIEPADKGVSHASGTQWTERGEIAVDWRRGRHGVSTEVDIPVNVTATVALPVAAGSAYRVSGRAEYLGTEDGRALYRVGSGHTGFRAVADK